jgi:hypothetical protein
MHQIQLLQLPAPVTPLVMSHFQRDCDLPYLKEPTIRCVQAFVCANVKHRLRRGDGAAVLVGKNTLPSHPDIDDHASRLLDKIDGAPKLRNQGGRLVHWSAT